MEERKFIRLKKEEFGIKESIKRNLGKGKISRLDIEYTPIGEKIIISTSKPGLVIGRKGEKIEELTRILKTRFKLENPHIEVKEIENPLFDAQLVADDIAMALERMGNLKFKVISYRKLQEIMNAGALGCELRVSGKLPSERAKSWRFAQGYLKKAGESRKEVDRAQATAVTKTGMIGVKVAIMAPDAKIYDKIDIDDAFRAKLKGNWAVEEEEKLKIKRTKTDNLKQKKDNRTQASESSSSSKVEKDTNKKTKKKEIKKDIENFDEAQEIPSKEDGTAIKIEEELEEGVPQDIIDKELKEAEKEHEEKTDKNPQDKENQIHVSKGENSEDLDATDNENKEKDNKKTNKPKKPNKEEI